MTDALLLDTCAAIWIAEGQTISHEALEAVEDRAGAKSGIRVSPITAWEIGMLVSKGRLTMSTTPHHWFSALTELPGLLLADMSAAILIDASFLPGKVHNDPADRILISTARTEGLTIVTRDQLILDYAAQGHVKALKC